MFKLGYIPWNKGLSSESDPRVARYAKSRKGRRNSKEHLEAVSRAQIALWQNPAYQAKQLESRNREELKLRRRQRMTGESNPRFGKEPWNKGKTGCYSKAVLQQMGADKIGKPPPMKGKHVPLEWIEKNRQAILACWQTPEYVAKQMRARGVKPNRSEQRLITLIAEASLPYRYVGNGQFILGGKCPDFLNINGKKQVIELFGSYWHNIFDVAKRAEHFRQYGFQTLVIWEDELKDTTKILSKITKFSKTRGEICLIG